jgi:lambda repressor-like predicted transcriptional regulator
MTAYILAALLSLSPVLQKDVPRAERYAADIVAAAQGDIDLALALVVTAEGESTFLDSREDCTVTGDKGASVSLYQLNRWAGAWQGYTREAICSSNTLATKLAAEWLVMQRLKMGDWRGAIRAYIGCPVGDARAVRRVRNFWRLKGGMT